MRLKESENGKIIVEQIGNSVYIRFYNITTWGSDETRRYMDITSMMSACEFIDIGEKITNIGIDVRNYMQKSFIESWDYNGISFTRELSPYWDPHPRHDIEINGYTFVYYPDGGDKLDIERYNLNIWNFHVPNYQKDHIYVRIVYNSVIDSMTDEEFFEESKNQINNLKNIL